MPAGAAHTAGIALMAGSAVVIRFICMPSSGVCATSPCGMLCFSVNSTFGRPRTLTT